MPLSERAMTLDDALALAERHLQERIDDTLIDFEDILRAKGGSAQEIETALYVYGADMAVWKTATLATLAKQIAGQGEVH